MNLLLCVALAILFGVGQLRAEKPTQPGANEATQDDAEAATRRLELIKDRLAVYDIYTDSDRQTKFDLCADPILRWNNPVSGVKDGFVFLWTQDGRPTVAAETFLRPEEHWVLNFQSLSTTTLIGDRTGRRWWFPAKPGVDLKAVSGAPSPERMPAQRLVQMRAIAREFVVRDDFQGKGWWELRLLPQPLYRYGNPESELIDGALFAFVQGTNPEGLLLLEARKVGASHEWQYALAPMTGYALEVAYRGLNVWSIPWRQRPRPDEPFYDDRLFPMVGTRLEKVRP